MYKNKIHPSSFIQKHLRYLPTTDSKVGRKMSLCDHRCSQKSSAQFTGSATGLQFRRHGGDGASAEKPLSAARVRDFWAVRACKPTSLWSTFTTHLGLHSQQSTFSSEKKPFLLGFLSTFRIRDSEETDLGTALFPVGE